MNKWKFNKSLQRNNFFEVINLDFWRTNFVRQIKLKTLFNIVEERFKKLLNFDVSAV